MLATKPKSPQHEADNETEYLWEITRYFEEKVERTVTPIVFWKDNWHRYVSLSRVAEKFLCVPASSVPCERLFSTSGFIYDDKRAALDPSSVRFLTFLNKNLDLVSK